MTCTEESKEHVEYTFHAFCKVVIRSATGSHIRKSLHQRQTPEADLFL